MITSDELYWIMILDNVRNLARGFIIVSSVVIFVSTFIYVVGKSDGLDDEAQIIKKIVYKIILLVSFLVLIVSSSALTFIPSTAQMAVIKVIPAIVNNEKLQSEAGEIYNLAKDGFKQFIERK